MCTYIQYPGGGPGLLRRTRGRHRQAQGPAGACAFRRRTRNVCDGAGVRTACACRPRSATPSISTRRSPTCKRPSAGPPGDTSVTRFCAFNTRPRGRLPRATVKQSSSSAGGALASPAAPLRVRAPAAVLHALAPAAVLHALALAPASCLALRCSPDDAPSRADEGADERGCGERFAAALARVTLARGRAPRGSPLSISRCRPDRALLRCSRSRWVLWVLWVL